MMSENFVNVLNEYFTSVFTKEQETLPKIDKKCSVEICDLIISNEKLVSKLKSLILSISIKLNYQIANLYIFIFYSCWFIFF